MRTHARDGDTLNSLEAWYTMAESEQVEALARFARRILAEYQLEVEGVQDIAVECGLLEAVEADGPCGFGCACEDYGFPATCFRATSVLGGSDG